MSHHRVFQNEFPYDSGRYSSKASPDIQDLIEWLTQISQSVSEKHSLDSIRSDPYKNGAIRIELSVEIEE